MLEEKHEETDDTVETDEASSDEGIIRLARERFKHCQDAYTEIHKQGRLDDEFSAGEQWPSDVKSDREAQGRPCLTVNRLSQFIRQVVNDQKQNNPSVTYSPEDDHADIETAKIYQGINRNIEKNSNADGARDWAFDGAARRGFGYWRLITDYVSPTSFLQEIKYQKIFDAYSVYLDPNHVEVDGSDATYAFIHSRLQKDEFCTKYGKSKLAKETEWVASSGDLPDYVTEDSCLVLEYYYKDFKQDKLLLLSDGQTCLKSKLKEKIEAGDLSPDLTVKDERETVTEIVRWVKIAGDEILEKTEWPSRWIPIIPTYGEVQVIEGKKTYKSVIRDAHDSQRMLNYFISAEAEAVGLAPKAPFVGAAGQFTGHEDKWATANARPHAFLEYNHLDENNNALPAPQRVVAEAQVQAITNARVQSQEDLKATTGIYDAALGAKSNENSGIAIQRRANQAQTSNYHFMANFEQSARHSGRIVAEVIPVIYDTPRVAKILGEDGESEIVKINQEFEHKGQIKTYDLSKGKYDISINMGPGYATKRQEALASMMEFAQMNPQIMAIAGDLIVKNADWPGSQEFMERIRKGMDPKFLDDQNGQQVPPQVQAQIAQMGMALQQAQAMNSDLQRQIEMKTIEIQSKERMKAAELETDLLKEQMKLSSDHALMQVQQQLAELQQWQMQLAHALGPALSQPQEPIPQFHNEADLATQPQFQDQQPTGGFPPG